MLNQQQEKMLEKTFNEQKEYFESHLKKAPYKERISKLIQLRKWIINNKQNIRNAIYNDFKKPEVEVDITDIKPVLWEIDLACANLKKWTQSKRVLPNLALLGTRSKILIEPLGVVLILAPWNFPFNLTVGPLISAIAAGNCAIVKPSELTPNTSELIQDMVNELFDPREVYIAQGDYTVAETLLKFPFNHIFFTGSPENGKKVMRAASDNLSSITLELGGQNPAIVDESSSIEDTAQKLLFGKFLNAGQSCLSVNYALVHKSVYDKLIESLTKEFYNFYPTQKNKENKIGDFSRIVNEKHFNSIKNLIEESIEKGAEIVLLGQEDAVENYVAPTILKNVSLNSPLLNQEIFGPILPIVKIESIEEAISIVNSKERPLATYIFSRDSKNINKIIKQTSSGTACINETVLQFVHPNLPFGGVNHSGIGKAHGYAGFLAFSNQRPILQQRIGMTSFKLIYPPYTNKVKTFVKWIMKYL